MWLGIHARGVFFLNNSEFCFHIVLLRIFSVRPWICLSLKRLPISLCHMCQDLPDRQSRVRTASTYHSFLRPLFTVAFSSKRPTYIPSSLYEKHWYSGSTNSRNREQSESSSQPVSVSQCYECSSSTNRGRVLAGKRQLISERGGYKGVEWYLRCYKAPTHSHPLISPPGQMDIIHPSIQQLTNK